MIDIDNIANIFEVDISLDELDSLLQELGTNCQYLEFSPDDWATLCVCANEVATTLNHFRLYGFIRPIIRHAVLGIVTRLQLKKLIRTIYFHSDCFMVPATSHIAMSTGPVNGIPINQYRNIWNNHLYYN